MPNWNAIANTVKSLLDNQQGLVQVFMIGGNTYAGTRTTLRRQDWESDAGLVEGDYQFSLLCPTGQFANVFPAPRTDKVTIGTTQYRILSVDADAVGACIKINLGNIIS